MEANKNLAFKNITDFPRGTLVALLKDGYAFEPKFAQYHNCIATSHKGNGYGTRQMREAVNCIIAQGASRIVVWTNERLTAARRMYERVGFTSIATSAETICPECAGQRIHYEMRLDPISTQQEYLK